MQQIIDMLAKLLASQEKEANRKADIEDFMTKLDADSKAWREEMAAETSYPSKDGSHAKKWAPPTWRWYKHLNPK
jgi:hypothetical protein